jgi:hypothetical protein
MLTRTVAHLQIQATGKRHAPVRFFWIGEESEIFAAESILQLALDDGQCGTGIGEFVVDAERGILLFDEDGDSLDWGEHDGTEKRLTVQDCDDEDNPRGTLTGSLHDIYAWSDGGRFGLPVMLLTQYN